MKQGRVYYGQVQAGTIREDDNGFVFQYAPKGHFVLSPAYDLVNTLAVLPSDSEELALNLNGKKRKITWHDFTEAMTRSNVPEKVQENMRKQFLAAQPAWEETICNSFLSPEMQQKYLAILSARMICLRNHPQ